MDYRAEVMRNCPHFETHSIEKKLDLGALGLSGEAAEVLEVTSDYLVAREGAAAKMVKEMGDVRWYLEYLETALGISYNGVGGTPHTTWDAVASMVVKCGAVTDQVKKVLHHHVPLESVRESLVEKVLSAHLALHRLADTLRVPMTVIEETNVAKLRARHPNGWTPESQQAKADEATGVS